MKESTGACGCGKVRFRLNSEILNTVNCHCNMCRNHNGGAFSTYAALPLKSVEFIQGKDHIKEYEFGTAKKYFCCDCGTPVFNTNSKFPGACMVYLGALNAHQEILPAINSWCESQLPWVENISALNNMTQNVPSE